MKYYELYEDMYVPRKWYLGEINNLSFSEQWGFILTSLCKFDNELTICESMVGIETDFTENLTYGVPIISDKLKLILSDYGCAFSYLNVENKMVKSNHYALGVSVIDCLCKEESIYSLFEKKGSLNSDFDERYKSLDKVVLDPKLINDKHIFRIDKYPVKLIVSEEIKNKISDQLLVGACFSEVDISDS